MQAKYKSLLENETWELTELAIRCKAVNCKWIYSLKIKIDGTVNHFKVRLVAKGCSLKYGVNFIETYSPTVKYDSIQLGLAIATQEDMHICQYDIKTAFLHG